MASIVTADVLRLVARLVLGYLDEQHLPEAHNVFCETSRHLTKEYLAYQEGTKSVDTSIGLVNIIAEYFMLKEKLNEFIRTCPKTSFIIQLIDTSSISLRFELIFKIIKDNILKFDEELPTTNGKRKRRPECEFNISQTNTSTPETNEPASKRRRISLPNPFVSLSACNTEKKASNVNDKSSLNRKELNYISSPETSNKEDDVSDTDEKKEEIPIKEVPSKIAPPPPELLSETMLRKPDFVETLADLINKTRSAKELESPHQASTSQNALTQTDVQDILSKTEHENDFEDILKEVIGKYLEPGDDDIRSNENDVQSTSSSPSKDESKPVEIPIKQRLRPRSAKMPGEKKKKLQKVSIISNELYTGPLPICLGLPPPEPIAISQPTTIEFIKFVPIMQPSTTFIPLQSALSQIPIISSPTAPVISEIENLVLESQEVQTTTTEVDKENKPSEKTQQTPKMPINASFRESKCKSTPRRKATHVRILDFNHTPSAASRLSTIKEFSTPLSGIKMETPGSAPASISVQKNEHKVEKVIEENLEIVDDSSNSTSISNTPKVAKNRRRRKIEVDTKKTDESPPKGPPMTRDEWDKMRAQQKSLSVDERMRLLFQESEVKVTHDKRKRKTPKKKKLLCSAKKSSGSEERQKSKENQTQIVKKVANRINGGGAKFKVTSPRKAALLRKTPKKKKLTKSPVVSVFSILTPNIDTVKQKEKEKSLTPPPVADPPAKVEEKTEELEKSENSDLNRSDTVQEVATLLTHLPETILAKTNSGTNLIETNKIDPQVLMETPLKLDTNISPLPNTPRFAVPLVAMSTQETPIPKTVVTTTTATSSAIPSLMKVCDILTPSFPITPGFKETPLKSDASPTSASGYSSRRTDYSSCSSYYKPDESEEINQNFELIIKQAREMNSQSESDGGSLSVSTEIQKTAKIRVGSAKKVECPGALDRVSSFAEEKKEEIPIPHYTMMEEGLLSESILTTASDSDSSSSFTCSTCSTDPSTDDETMDILNQSDLPEDAGVDVEWKCEHAEVNESNNSLVDEKTGEVRFPLRNLMTPRKMEQEIKDIINTEAKKVKESQPSEPPKNIIMDLEAIKQRTLRILKNDSASTSTNSKRNPTKLNKNNAKTFKLPLEQRKVVPLTRREQILSQNLTERSRPTPLKLIPSSSSRRKNATPRKTIIIDELPKAPSPTKKTRVKKKSESSTTKSPSKPERVSLENISDNAVMHDDHPSLNISSSFHIESSDDEIGKESTTKTVINCKKEVEEGSNTFQQAMISQGFDKKEVKELEAKFNEEKSTEPETKVADTNSLEDGEISSSGSGDEDDQEEECTLVLSDMIEKFIFNFEESKGEKVKKSYAPLSTCPPAKLQIEDKTVKIDFSATMDIFSMEPETQKKEVEKKKNDKTSTKVKAKSKGISSKESKTESILNNDPNVIDKILSMLHPSK